MKRFLLPLTLFLVACGNSTSDPSPMVVPQVESAIYQGDRVQIEYPSDWTVIERAQDIVLTDLYGIETAADVTNLSGRLDGSIIYLNQFDVAEIENSMMFLRTDIDFEENVLQRFATEMQFEEISPAPFRLSDGQIGLSANELKQMNLLIPGVIGESYVTLGTVFDEDSNEHLALLLGFSATKNETKEIQSILSSIEFNE